VPGNRHLKIALDQALILRGSRDFADVADWRRFVDRLVARRNHRREDAVRVEATAQRPLPARRATDSTENRCPRHQNGDAQTSHT